MILELVNEVKNRLKGAQNPLVAVLGPTASGKTKLSLVLAKELDAEIISADSRQLYKGLEIGADALPIQEQAGIPHHLLSFLEPNAFYTLVDYMRDAGRIISDIYNRGKTPMMVGGTGLYMSSISEGYQLHKVAPDFEFRYKLQNEYEQFGIEYLYEKLKKIDPEAASKIHPNNVRYVIRALEINHQTQANKKNAKQKSPYTTVQIGLEWPRDILYDRINTRVDKQIARGLVEEVKALLPYVKTSSPAYSSLGFKEIAEYINGNKTLEEAIELVKKNTRNYAKRQLTWFRKNKDIIWLDGESVEKELAQYQL